MIAFVNGYLCTSSCDEAKARAGKNPHPKTDANQDPTKAHIKNGVYDPSKSNDPTQPGDPAVVYGGALASPRNPVTASGATQPSVLNLGQGSAGTVDFFA